MVNRLTDLLTEALVVSGFPLIDPAVVLAPKDQAVDYASPVALSVARKVNQEPKSVAQEIKRFLETQSSIKSVKIAGPGFLNIEMTEEWFEQQLAISPVIGTTLSGKKIIVDYSSPNIAKPMHVGHLRTTILGQVLVNLYRLLGAEAIAWSHQGDWGTQFGKLLIAWTEWGDEEKLEHSPIDELLRIYVKFHQEAAKRPELEDRARAAFKSLQDGDESALVIWQRFVKYSQIEFEMIYQLLRVNFDVNRPESTYNHLVQQLVDDALEAKVAQLSQGAVIIPLDQVGLPPFMIRKSDGSTLYSTVDLASIGVRVKEEHPDELVYVVGNEQTLHFQQLFASASILAEKGVYGDGFILPKLTHISYGFFRLPTGKMSTRQGEIIRLNDLLDQAKDRARKMLLAKDRTLSQASLGDLADEIGIAAVKYTDLFHDRHTDVIFDWDKMFNLEGNSIVYLMYTFVRCSSLLKQAKKIKPVVQDKVVGWSRAERLLALTLFDLPEQLDKCIKQYDPHFLLDHTYKLASQFSYLYASEPILKADTSTRQRRLDLTTRVRNQLKLMFDLLGIQAPNSL